eukprot:TRINITY_DN2736_c0_g2_i19.p1 TRINITY_DN2736_c0_g2~~TRINITY_DN2736_c0_g2_i19.p1  ORF type:complete len:104 (-),score=39.52 TRINITY_DN2736_c0_g2_i19:126-437(-)
MTEEQMKKYGVQGNTSEGFINHTRANVKEHGVSIKVMTLEEQKKAEEEKERRKKEREERLLAKEEENTIPCENMDLMFEPDLVLYTHGEKVLLSLPHSTNNIC